MTRPDWIPDREHYVVITEFDTRHRDGTEKGPLVGEQYLGADGSPQTSGSIDDAIRFSERIGDSYGRTAIARLDFQTRITLLPDGRMGTEDAARYTGLTVKTMAAMRSRREGPAYVKLGRVTYFKSDLDEWIARQRVVHQEAPDAGNG